jgi:hypothetical protein
VIPRGLTKFLQGGTAHDLLVPRPVGTILIPLARVGWGVSDCLDPVVLRLGKEPASHPNDNLGSKVAENDDWDYSGSDDDRFSDENRHFVDAGLVLVEDGVDVQLVYDLYHKI